MFLKREVRTQLQGTTILRRSSSQGVDRGSSRRDCAITTATGGQHPGGWANVESLSGQSQGRMVEGVVGVGTHFHVNPFVDPRQLSQINFDLYARANETSSLFPILRPENGRDLPVVY